MPMVNSGSPGQQMMQHTTQVYHPQINFPIGHNAGMAAGGYPQAFFFQNHGYNPMNQQQLFYENIEAEFYNLLEKEIYQMRDSIK